MNHAIKQLALSAGFCSLLALPVQAEDSHGKAGTSPAAAVTAPGPVVPPAAPNNAKPTAPAAAATPNPLQLTEKQQQLMADWSKLQQDHLITTLTYQDRLEELAITNTLDEAALKKTVAEITKDEETYYLSYAAKNRAFVNSLTPEQRQKFEKGRKQRKENMAKRIEKLKALQKDSAGKSGAP